MLLFVSVFLFFSLLFFLCLCRSLSLSLFVFVPLSPISSSFLPSFSSFLTRSSLSVSFVLCFGMHNKSRVLRNRGIISSSSFFVCVFLWRTNRMGYLTSDIVSISETLQYRLFCLLLILKQCTFLDKNKIHNNPDFDGSDKWISTFSKYDSRSIVIWRYSTLGAISTKTAAKRLSNLQIYWLILWF